MGKESAALAMALGHVGEEERENLLLLCQAAEQELTQRLKEGVAAEDCSASLALAAAWMALEALEERDGVESFSAGDMTIRTAGNRGNGRLRRQAEQVMAPYLRDDQFCFRGVQG